MSTKAQAAAAGQTRPAERSDGGAVVPLRAPSRLERMPLRSDEVQDILSAMPSVLLRWGITAISGTFLLILAAMWFVRYPEVLDGRVVVVSETPPVPVIARTDGKVVRLLAREDDLVSREQTLVVLESTADPNDMEHLSSALQAFRTKWLEAPERTLAAAFSPQAQLGDMQAAYSAFLQAREDYRLFIETDPFPERVRTVQAQIASHERLDAGLAQQVDILAQQVEVLQRRLSGDEALLDKGALSDFQVQETHRQWLQQNAQLKAAQAERLRNDVLIAQYRRQMAELHQERRERRRLLERAVADALERLLSEVADWRYRFVLTAPTDGRLAFFDVWTPDQQLRAGKEVMFVVPEQGSLMGRMPLSQRGIGRVHAGNRVRVQFDSYPAHQFGSVRSEVVSISGTSRDAEHIVTLSFPQGLLTSYNRRLPFRQGMGGAATIITEDVRLLVRAFAPLRHLFQNLTEVP